MSSYLWSGMYGQSAADLLGTIRSELEQIRAKTDQLSFDGSSRLQVTTT
jgi:hypothetical protein